MARPKRKVNPVRPTPAVEASNSRVYRTGGYARLSVEDSGRSGADTIAMQEELILEYIQTQADMQFCGLYSDNGRTGTNFDRPAFERLMEDVRTGRIDCIIVKDLSRFGRNYKEAGNYLERIFPFLDVRFVAINDHFDTLTAERTAEGYIVPLKNMINEAYSKDISRKICPALAAKQQRGEFIGSWAPYGYRKCAEDTHHIELEEETAPVVWDIFQWRLSGMGCTQIARRLNDLGVPSPSRYHYLNGDAKSDRYANVLWHCQVVKKILSNEVYLGQMVQGRTRSGFREGQRQKLVPKSEWVIVRNTHTPLIDEQTFRAVQEMAEERRSAYQERLGRYDELGTIPNIFRGLIFCADCKRPMVRYKSVTNKGKNLYYVFICPSHADDPRSCPKKYLHESELKEVLWDVLRKQIELAGYMEKLARGYSRSSEVGKREKALECEAASAQQALERSRMLYDSLYQNYVNHLMTEREFTELKRRYRADMEAAQKRLDEVTRQQQRELRQSVKNPWLTAFGHYRNAVELTEDLAHALIESVTIDANNRIDVRLRYQDEYCELAQLLEQKGVQTA